MDQDELNEKFRSTITENDLPEAKNLLNQGAQINSQTTRGGTALTMAMNTRSKKAFDWLIAQGADINVPNYTGESLLMRAIRTDSVEYFNSLMSAKPNLDATDSYGMTALLYACSYRAGEYIEKLVKAGADITKETVKKSNALLMASSSGTYLGVISLLEAGADIEVKDWQGQTPLMASVHLGTKEESEAEKYERLAVVKCLIKHKANPNVRSPSGLTALFSACLYGMEESAIEIIDAGGAVNITHGYMKEKNITPLHLSAKQGKVKMSLKLLDAGADPNSIDSEGNSPAAYGYMVPKLREMFLAFQGDVNAILHHSKEKIPAVSHVILGHDKETFDEMIKRGVKLYFEDPAMDEYQPIRLAISVCMPDMAEAILQASPQDLNVLWGFKQANTKEKTFMSPLMMLVGGMIDGKISAALNQIKLRQELVNQKDENGNHRLSESDRKAFADELKPFVEIEEKFLLNRVELFKLLLNNGAKVDFADRDGNTALFYAPDKENIDALLNAGAELFHRDNHGLTPFGATFVTGQIKTAKILNEIVVENKMEAHQGWQSTVLDLAYAELPSNRSSMAAVAMIKELIPDGDSRLSYREPETGNTPLLVASATEFGSLAQLLIEKGVPVNQTNDQGETALHHAVATKNALLIEFLLEKGADATLASKSGVSAWNISQELGDGMVKGIILKHYDPDVDVSGRGLARRIKAA